MDLEDTDLLFSCGVDRFSESEIIDKLELINYLVDNLVITILCRADETFTLSCVPETSPDSDTDIVSILTKLSAKNALNFLVDFLLRKVVVSSLHAVFFRGKLFFWCGLGKPQRNLGAITGTAYR